MRSLVRFRATLSMAWIVGACGSDDTDATSATTEATTMVATTTDATMGPDATTQPADDSDGDGASDNASTTDVDVLGCGPGAYANVTGTMRSLLDDAVIPGVRLTTEVCPEMEFFTDDRGYLELQMTRDVPFILKVEHPDFLPQLGTVLVIEDDLDATGAMIPTSVSGLLPHWSDDAPTVLVVVFLAEDELPDDAPAECHSREGIVVSLPDHPQAVITYFSGTMLPTPDPNLTATGEIGLAEISGVPATAPGETIAIAIDSPCRLASLTSYPHRDRIPLQDGVLTGVSVRIPALPWPSGEPPMP